MIRIVFSIVVMFSLAIFCNAQNKITQFQKAEKYLKQRNEVFLKFKNSNYFKVKKASKILSIDKVTEDYIWAYANKNEFERFEKLDIDFDVLTPPSMLKNVKMAENLKSADSWDSYPTYNQYLSMMSAFAQNHSDICKLVEIGTSNNDRKILFVKISDNVNEKEAEPEFMYTSTIHGDEATGYVLMLHLIDYLLANYETNIRVKELVDNIEIWINPLANPDGTYANGNETVYGATRNNANGIDLNRNFPDPIDGEYPNGPRQKETQIFMDFMTQHNFVHSANIHDGVEVMNYPWDTYPQKHADDLWFYHISQQYVDTVHEYSDSYFRFGGTGITNGYDWYSINGGRQDYMTYFLRGREITIELSNNKTADASTLPTLWNYNYRSFLNYIEQCTYGISGIITDKDSGEPIKAKITVKNHDIDNSEIYSEATNGNYHRFLDEEQYDLEFTAYGYYSKEINDVNVVNLETTELNVQLEKWPADINKLNREEINMCIQNPVTEHLKLRISANCNCSANLVIYNLLGTKIMSKQIDIINSQSINSIDLSSLKSGQYILHISNNKSNFTRKFCKF